MAEAEGKGWWRKCADASTDNRSLRTAAIVFFVFWIIYRSAVWLVLALVFLALSAKKSRPRS